jgi:hypothetical protein
MYEPTGMGKPTTDFAAYGLSDPASGLSKRTGTNKTNTDKVTDDFISDVWNVLDTAGNLLIKKHHDYGPKNIALSPGGPLNGLRVRMWDKIARINNLLDSGVKPSNESLRDSFIDLLNYSAIAMMVLDGTWPESPELDCD